MELTRKSSSETSLFGVQASFPGCSTYLWTPRISSKQTNPSSLIDDQLIYYTFVIIPYSESNQWLNKSCFWKNQPPQIKSTFLSYSVCRMYTLVDPTKKNSLPKIQKPPKVKRKKNGHVTQGLNRKSKRLSDFDQFESTHHPGFQCQLSGFTLESPNPEKKWNFFILVVTIASYFWA